MLLTGTKPKVIPSISLKQRSLAGYWQMATAGAISLLSDPHGPKVFDVTNVNATAGIGPSTTLRSAASFNNNGRLTNNGTMPPPAGSFTVAGWARWASNAVTDALCGQYQSADGRSWMVIIASGMPQIVVSISGSASSISQQWGSTLSIDTWYFIVAGYDQARGRSFLSVNGSEFVYSSGGVTPGTPLFQTTSPFSFAAIESSPGTFASFLVGLEAEWGYWNRILTMQEILWLYNNGNGNTISTPKV